MKLSPSGCSVTTSNARKSAPPPTRTKNKGWTKHAALRNRQFLWSVVPQQLSGFGFSITHTVFKCDSPDQWAKWQTLYLKTVRYRWPLVRFHIVTEWQRRGMPHLHGAFWFGSAQAAHGGKVGALCGSGPNGSIIRGKDIPSEKELIKIWMRVAAQGEPSTLSQDVKTITSDDAGHWLQYLAKHAVRGVSNYQRSAENIPSAWKGKTGRVWRRGGDWPTENRLEVHGLTQAEKYQYRRIFCRYLASLPASMRIRHDDRSKVRKFWANWRKSSDIARSHLRAPSSFIDIEKQVRIIQCINPDAYFTDEKTGEVYTSIDQMPVQRKPNWSNPAMYRHETTMDDLDCT